MRGQYWSEFGEWTTPGRKGPISRGCTGEAQGEGAKPEATNTHGQTSN